jgi:hypothetical protein
MKDRKGNPVKVGNIILMTVYSTERGWAEPIQEKCKVLKIDGHYFDAEVLSTGYVNHNISERSIKKVIK